MINSYVLCPQGKMLSKQQVLSRIRFLAMFDFQYAQVKSFIAKLQTNGRLNWALSEFEKLMIKPDQKHLLSILYKMLLATGTFVDVVR